ncbi:MAG: HPF/RaiA family ribosome-associated protein [Planctomycetota bacterium]|nr:HPF/RaiA family ribosome-associated protein [Planctomycetota bacterium]
MQIQINFGNIPASAALEQQINERLDSEIGRFRERLTRVEVHVSDVNSHARSGPDDKRCLMEARPAGLDPVSAEAHHEDLYTAIREAARKLLRVLEHRFKTD